MKSRTRLAQLAVGAVVGVSVVVGLNPSTPALGQYPGPYPGGGQRVFRVALPALFRNFAERAYPAPQPAPTNTSTPASPTPSALLPTSTPIPAPTASPTVVPTNTPVRCNGSTQVLLNSSFETSGSWVKTGSAYIDSRRALDGRWAAFFGGYDGANDFMAQTVPVPTWAETGALYFATNVFSLDSTFTGYDGLQIGVFDQGANFLAAGAVWNNSPRNVWRTWRMPVSSVAANRGGTMTVAFLGTTDASLFTSWWADRVWLVFGCGDTPAMSAQDAGAAPESAIAPPASASVAERPLGSDAAAGDGMENRSRTARSTGAPSLAEGDFAAVRAAMSRGR